MKQVLLVFLGGGAGSVLRYIISRLLNPETGFPLGTLTVNLFGSLLIGLILGAAMKNGMFSGNSTLLLATGFCGGFTTFSAFAFENQVFLKTGDYFSLATYIAISLGGGIAAVFGGLYLARFV